MSQHRSSAAYSNNISYNSDLLSSRRSGLLHSTTGSAPKRRRTGTIGNSPFNCVVCREPFKRRTDLWEHLTAKENGVNVFVCLDCGRGFRKERLLRNHPCNFNEEEIDQQQQQQQPLSVFCHIIACQECGLFVPLVNVETPSWKGYSTFCGHSSRSFRKITLYTWTAAAIQFIKNNLMNSFNVVLDMGPAVISGISLSCDICGETYEDLDDAEIHISTNHPDDATSIGCEHCGETFRTELSIELHMNEAHDRARLDILDLLNMCPAEEPFKDPSALGRSDRYVFCDLCGLNIWASEFNNHECAVNNTKRYLLDDAVVYCNSKKLEEVYVDMGLQNPLVYSLEEKTQRRIDLCLRFSVPVIAPKIDDVSNDVVYSCKHCERVFISPAVFREHVTEVFQLKRMNGAWQKIDAEGQQALEHFGLAVEVGETGLICPKRDCNTIVCSTIAMERHIRNSHADTFQQLTIPPPLPGVNNSRSTSLDCPICHEKYFAAVFDLKCHLKLRHQFVCSTCGSCYSTVANWTAHMATNCTRELENSPKIGYCSICTEIFPNLDKYYSHLVDQHPIDVKVDQGNGQILPKCGLILSQSSTVTTIHTNGNRSMPNGSPDPVVSSTTVDGMHDAENVVYESDHNVNSNGSIVSSSGIAEENDPNQNYDDIQENEQNMDSNDIVQDNQSTNIDRTLDAENARIPTSVQSEDSICNQENTNEDDEVVVCDPALSGASSGRPPTHGCPFCSCKFYTAMAAEEHRVSQHASEVGETIAETLPVPDGMNVYVCRQCSLAFECQVKFAKHTMPHRRMYDCEKCIAIAMNPKQLEEHKQFHESVRVAYGCVVCKTAFRSEATLLLHLHTRHQVPILWCCKKCGLANTNLSPVKLHVCVDMINTPVWSLIQPTSKKKLHFQPRDQSTAPALAKAAKANQVAECVHRTSLACKETAVACDDCGSIIPASQYFAEKGTENRMRFQMADMTEERSLAEILTPAPVESTVNPIGCTILPLFRAPISTNREATTIPRPTAASTSCNHHPFIQNARLGRNDGN